jgi:hypothetical protein
MRALAAAALDRAHPAPPVHPPTSSLMWVVWLAAVLLVAAVAATFAAVRR